MKQFTLVFALVAVACMRDVHGQPPLSEDVEKQLPAALENYKILHASPELSHFEEKTAALVAKELKSAGCEVFTGIGKFTRAEWKGHGVAGVFHNGEGPVVLVRAELDALPLIEQTGLPYASRSG
jgi:metal-dependent amidase/aminoacylase/carboxypeptidase family protein